MVWAVPLRGYFSGNRFQACRQQFDESLIELHIAAFIRGPAKMKRALDFAALQFVADLLPECLFLRAQVVGQFELHVEIAMIDGP